MLLLTQAAVVAYLPLPGALPAHRLPDSRWLARPLSGPLIDVFVWCSPLKAEPPTVEIRTHAPPPVSLAVDTPPARWPTLEEIQRIVDVTLPAGLPMAVLFQSGGPDASYPDPTGPRVLRLHCVGDVQAVRPAAAVSS